VEADKVGFPGLGSRFFTAEIAESAEKTPSVLLCGLCVLCGKIHSGFPTAEIAEKLRL
jgi:hypothetical protein